MSTDSYFVPAGNWQIELDIKRSQFICLAARAANRTEAEIFIRSLRQQYADASHVCWAYIAGAPDTTARSMSDDGEPSGTAGMPMLKVLQHSGVGEIVVAVVRYFGGTKLGTGGLQRAYSDAVAEVLKEMPLVLQVSRTCFSLIYDYVYEAVISRLLSRYDTADIQSDYGQQITTCVAIADKQISQWQIELINVTSAKITISRVSNMISHD